MWGAPTAAPPPRRVPPPGPPLESPLDPPEPPAIGRGGMGPGGGGGGAGACTGGFGAGAAVQGSGRLSWMVTPWSLTLTGVPLAVTSPPFTVASPPPPESELFAVTSTMILLTFTVPMTKLSTSECVITVRLPPESITVFVWPHAPLNGCVPPPA